MIQENLILKSELFSNRDRERRRERGDRDRERERGDRDRGDRGRDRSDSTRRDRGEERERKRDRDERPEEGGNIEDEQRSRNNHYDKEYQYRSAEDGEIKTEEETNDYNVTDQRNGDPYVKQENDDNYYET